MAATENQLRQTRRGVRAWSHGAWFMTVVAAIAVALWLTSFWYHAVWMNPNGTLVGFARGEVHEISFPPATALRAVPPGGDVFIARNGAPNWWSGHIAGPPTKATITGVALHWWAVGIAAAWWGVIVWRLNVLREPHECWHCAYDRRGLSSDVACPECGSPARPPATRA